MPTPTPSSQPATPTLEVSDALRRDASAMAEELGISVDEALRRLQYQDGIGDLQAALMANEHDTFAGLWIEHQPEYRIVIARDPAFRDVHAAHDLEACDDAHRQRARR